MKNTRRGRYLNNSGYLNWKIKIKHLLRECFWLNCSIGDKNLHKSPSPWARARSCRTCKADCRLPSAVSLLCDFGSRNAGTERKREGKLNSATCTMCVGDKKILADSAAYQRVQRDSSTVCRRVPFGLFGKAEESAPRRVAVDHVARVFRGESVRGK